MNVPFFLNNGTYRSVVWYVVYIWVKMSRQEYKPFSFFFSISRLTGAGTSLLIESSSLWIILWLPVSDHAKTRMCQSSSNCSPSATLSWWITMTVTMKSNTDKREVKWNYGVRVNHHGWLFFCFFYSSSQVSWCTRLLLLTRAPWWRQPGTSAMCFCPVHRTPSLSGKWTRRQPMGCWRCSTLTPTASECLLSVWAHKHMHTKVTYFTCLLMGFVDGKLSNLKVRFNFKASWEPWHAFLLTEFKTRRLLMNTCVR